MFANVHSEIDLRQGVPTIDTFKEHFEDFTINIHLEPDEIVSLFREYIKDNLDIDLNMLNVLIIFDIKHKKLILDTEELEENDINELIYLQDEFKHYFGKSIFDIRCSINTNVLFRRLLGDYNEYKWNEDGSINIEYSLYNITKEEINKYIGIDE